MDSTLRQPFNLQCLLKSHFPQLIHLDLFLFPAQFLTFKDGKFGVNFGGYHAEAGLGGLLTGNAAHGGLSASAGTPHGQQAGAGLGGILDGNGNGLGGFLGAFARSPGRK